MGRHAAAAATFDAVVDDYVTQRARELVRQIDHGEIPSLELAAMNEWIGAAAEILRELTRDA
jgi:hypothetical protein